MNVERAIIVTTEAGYNSIVYTQGNIIAICYLNILVQKEIKERNEKKECGRY